MNFQNFDVDAKGGFSMARAGDIPVETQRKQHKIHFLLA